MPDSGNSTSPAIRKGEIGMEGAGGQRARNMTVASFSVHHAHIPPRKMRPAGGCVSAWTATDGGGASCSVRERKVIANTLAKPRGAAAANAIRHVFSQRRPSWAKSLLAARRRGRFHTPPAASDPFSILSYSFLSITWGLRAANPNYENNSCTGWAPSTNFIGRWRGVITSLV